MTIATQPPRRRRAASRQAPAEAAAPTMTPAEIRAAEMVRPPLPETPAVAPPIENGAPEPELTSAQLAEQRAQELLEGGLVPEESIDEFTAPTPPDGWTYEWKTHTVAGAIDHSRVTQQQRMGWEPVPASRHPEMMPLGYTGSVIEKKGMMLMQRPKQITDRVVMFERRKAMDQVRVKEAQLGQARAGEFERGTNPNAPVRVGKEYAPPAFAIPGNSKGP